MSPAAVLTVNAGGGADFTSIQAAIAAAGTGDEVQVAAGTYAEQLDFLGKAITVRAVGAAVINPDDVQAAVGVRFENGEGPGSVLEGFTIRRCLIGIRGQDSSPTIRKNLIEDCNEYGIRFEITGPTGNCAPVIEQNELRGNRKGGMWLASASTSTRTQLRHNMVYQNWTDGGLTLNGGPGGAIGGFDLFNMLVVENLGWGIRLEGPAEVNIESTTISGNSSGGVRRGAPGPATVLRDSIVWQVGTVDLGPGVEFVPTFCDIEDPVWAGGAPTYVLNVDPLFTVGPGWPFVYYLNNFAAGTPPTSPCVNVGSCRAEEAGDLTARTTRSDGRGDGGVLDLGFHFPMIPENHQPAAPSNPSPADGEPRFDQDGTLTWTATDPDGDPLIYNLYFGTMPDPPIAAQGLTSASYQPSGLIYGQQYWWYVRVFDPRGAERTGPVWTFTVQEAPTDYPLSFAAGLHMIGASAEPVNVDAQAVWGTTAIQRWDPATSAYRSYPNDWTQVRLGRSNWVFFAGATNPTVSGHPADTAEDFSVELTRGWNQSCVPFLTPMDYGALTTNPSGALSPFAWAWVSGAYQLITALPGYPGSQATVNPWEGFWALCLVDSAQLIFPGPGAGGSSVAEASAAEEDGWAARITVECGGSRDEANYFGVRSSGAVVIPNPPMPARLVDLCFVRAEGRPLGGDLRAPGEPLSWELAVSGALAGETVTLRWPDLSGVPRNLSLILTDTATGKRVSLRTAQQYAYQAGEAETRRLRLEATEGGVGAMTVAGLSAVPTANGGVTAQYTLSRSAAVEATVLNIAGRTVRSVARGELHEAGVNTLSWDGRSSDGVRVPSGRYLVRIRARAADGQQSSAVTSVVIQR